MGRADLRPSNLHFSCHVGHARARFLLAVCACFLSIPEYSKFVLRLINSEPTFLRFSFLHLQLRPFPISLQRVSLARSPFCLLSSVSEIHQTSMVFIQTRRAAAEMYIIVSEISSFVTGKKSILVSLRHHISTLMLETESVPETFFSIQN